MAWEGIAYSIGHYKGRGSTYDRGNANKEPEKRLLPRWARWLVKFYMWVLFWGWFVI